MRNLKTISCHLNQFADFKKQKTNFLRLNYYKSEYSCFVFYRLNIHEQ